MAAIALASAAVVSALVAIYSASKGRAIYKATVDKLKQDSDQYLIMLFNQHNWTLFGLRKELPPALPSWRDLSEKAWAWRVLHLNHLNLLQLIYWQKEKNVIADEEFRTWVRMSKFWFTHLRESDRDEDIREGCKAMRQILKPEEGYSFKFRYWLFVEEIIPSTLFPSDITDKNM